MPCKPPSSLYWFGSKRSSLGDNRFRSILISRQQPAGITVGRR